MEAPNYNQELANLSSQVKNFSPGINTETNPDLKPLDSATPQSKPMTMLATYSVYAIIPVVIAVLLLLTRISIVTDVQVNEETKEETRKLSWKKLGIWTIVVSIPLIVGLYIFQNKKAKKM